MRINHLIRTCQSLQLLQSNVTIIIIIIIITILCLILGHQHKSAGIKIKVSKNKDHDDGVPHGVKCSQEGECNPPLESNGQLLEQEHHLSRVFRGCYYYYYYYY